MSDNPGSQRLSSYLLVALGAIVFVALIILGDALVSVWTKTDVIEVKNAKSYVPIIAIGAATLVWFFSTRGAVKRRGGFGSAIFIALFATIFYGLGFAVAMVTSGLTQAMSATTHLLTAGYIWVPVVSGLITATAILALSRTSGASPQWPWEKQQDDE